MKHTWSLFAALGLVSVWWYWRVDVPISDTGLRFLNFDLYSYYEPTVRFGVESLAQRHLPLWNPYQLAGVPFFANQQHGLLYPPNLLYAVLPSRLAFEWSAIAHYVLALLFSFYLGRTLGLSGGPATVAAVIFAFGGYLPNLLYLRTWLNGAVWLPLEMALVIRLFRDTRRGTVTVLLSAVLACQYLGGYPLYSLLSGYCLALFALWQSIRLAQQGQWRTLLAATTALGAAAVAAAALSAVQLLPMIEMTDLSPRKLGGLSPLAVPTAYGANQLRSVFLPVATPGGRASMYLGGAILPFVLASLFHPRLRGMAAFLIGLGGLAAALAAGPLTPLYGLYLHLPTSTWFRFPGEFVYLVAFALTFAAGIGAEVLSKGSAWRLAVRATFPTMVLLLVALWMRTSLWPAAFAGFGRTTSVTLIAAATLALVVAARSRRLAWAVLLIGIWVDLSLAFANYLVIPDIDRDRFEPPAALMDFLHAQPGVQRTYFHVPPMSAPVAKVGMLHQVFTVSDHESLIPARYGEYLARLQDGAPPSPFRPPQGGVFLDARRKQMPLLDLLGVRYLVTFSHTPFVDEAEAAAYREVFAGPGFRVHENPRALPRAFVVGTTQVMDPSTILSALASPSFDPRTTALVESASAHLAGGTSHPAEITAYAAEDVTVETNGDTAGMLILTDQFYPGWLATVDGQPVPIFCADYIFRAVPLPAGAHTVRFHYQPRSFTIGLWISGLTLVVLAVLLLAFAPQDVLRT